MNELEMTPGGGGSLATMKPPAFNRDAGDKD
jgi:hypothetical protein